MKKIYQYLDPNANSYLSDLSESEWQYFYELLNEFQLELRLNQEQKEPVLFGMEIESDYANWQEIISHLALVLKRTDNSWEYERDLSILSGIEIISPPSISNPQYWQELSFILSVMRKYSEISNRCGAHIHIHEQILERNTEYWLRLLKFWSAYEDILFRFGFGEYLAMRDTICHTLPVTNKFRYQYEKLKNCSLSFSELIDAIHSTHSQSICFFSGKGVNHPKSNSTIEFRLANGTLNPVIWQNLYETYLHVLYYVKSSHFQDDIVTKRMNEPKVIPAIDTETRVGVLDLISPKNKNISIQEYTKINREKALEFADLIFDNNLDKLYFLRQYFKGCKLDTPDKKSRFHFYINQNDRKEKFEKAKVFTKIDK